MDVQKWAWDLRLTLTEIKIQKRVSNMPHGRHSGTPCPHFLRDLTDLVPVKAGVGDSGGTGAPSKSHRMKTQKTLSLKTRKQERQGQLLTEGDVLHGSQLGVICYCFGLRVQGGNYREAVSSPSHCVTGLFVFRGFLCEMVRGWPG